MPVRMVSDEDSQFEFEKTLLLRFLGDRLYAARFQNGLTQQDLANLLGIQQARYAEFELGMRDFRISFLIKLATVFKNSLSDWLPSAEEFEDWAWRMGHPKVKRRGPGMLKN